MGDEEVREGSRDVPPTVEPRVETVMAWLAEMRNGEDGDALGASSALMMPSQNPAVISILGGQGVGKSTTLRFVCERAGDHPRRLVLPVVSPERFADGDTLFGWVLSAISERLVECMPEVAESRVPRYRDDLTMAELARLLCRQEALARKSHQESTVIGSAHPDEWAESIAAVTTAGLRLVRGWAALLEGLSEHLDQLMIPIDDADQVPSLLGTLLRDLRWLTLDPMVAVVICANEGMLVEALSGEPELSRMDLPSQRSHAVGVLTKALPRHLRLSVAFLEPGERLAFKPPGKSDTMIEVLRRCQLVDPPPIEPSSLADLFELRLGNEHIPSPHADLLPETPRELVHLWHELQSLIDASPKNLAGEAGRLLIEGGIERALNRAPDLPEDSIEIFETESHGLAIQFDFDHIAMRRRAGAGRTIFRTGPGDRVSMRRQEGFPLARVRDADNTPLEAYDLLPVEFARAHDLGLDLSDPDVRRASPFYLWGYVHPLSLPGGDGWKGMVEVEFEGASADDCFALVPDWEGRYDYLLYAAAWNRIWAKLMGSALELSSGLLEWLLLKHVELVLEVQAKRAVSVPLMEAIETEPDDLDALWSRDAAMESVATRLRELYRVHDDGTVREGDFATWVESFLPAIADPLLGVPDFAERLLSVREETLESNGRLEVGNRACAEFLARRIHGAISAGWVTETIKLLHRFDPDRAESLASLHEVASEERDIELQALESMLENRGVPRGVIGELFIGGVTEELAHDLRVAGLPPAAIEALAMRLAPTVSLSPPGAKADPDA